MARPVVIPLFFHSFRSFSPSSSLSSLPVAHCVVLQVPHIVSFVSSMSYTHAACTLSPYSHTILPKIAPLPHPFLPFRHITDSLVTIVPHKRYMHTHNSTSSPQPLYLPSTNTHQYILLLTPPTPEKASEGQHNQQKGTREHPPSPHLLRGTTTHTHHRGKRYSARARRASRTSLKREAMTWLPQSRAQVRSRCGDGGGYDIAGFKRKPGCELGRAEGKVREGKRDSLLCSPDSLIPSFLFGFLIPHCSLIPHSTLFLPSLAHSRKRQPVLPTHPHFTVSLPRRNVGGEGRG